MLSRLDRVFLKIERAKKHIRDLDERIRLFRESKPYKLRIKRYRITKIEHTISYIIDSINPVPDDIALIIGDSVHNLRSSLDHLAWQLVESNSQIPNPRTQFPISESPEKYKSALEKGAIQGIRVEAQELIRTCQRYVMNDDILWHLHQLDRIDKHRLLISVAATLGELGMDISDGISEWFGATMLTPLVQGYELLSIPAMTHSRQHNKNLQLGLEIAFAEPKIVERKSVVETLNKMADFVYGLVGRFKSFLV